MEPWDVCREQSKENPGAVVARRAGKMLIAMQHGGELEGMLGGLPSRQEYPCGAGAMGSAAGEQQLVAQPWGVLHCVF